MLTIECRYLFNNSTSIRRHSGCCLLAVLKTTSRKTGEQANQQLMIAKQSTILITLSQTDDQVKSIHSVSLIIISEWRLL